MIYDKAYFIAKFTALDSGLWTDCGRFRDNEGRKCARGHCDNDEHTGLYLLFAPNGITAINDGGDPRYQQPNPRARVLAALNDLP